MQYLTESNYSHELKWSEELKLIYLLKGAIHMQVGSLVYSLHENDFFFIKPYEIFASLEKGSYIAFEVNADMDDINHICPELVNLNFDLRLIKANDELPLYYALASNMAEILHLSGQSGPLSQTRFHKCVCNIMELLTENLSSPKEAEDKLLLEEKSLNQDYEILRYISTHYMEPVSLNSIAHAMGFHPQYFSAYFKKHFGTTFLEYLNTYRVNQSLSALANTNDSILDIAIINGFNNHKTYSSAFKKAINGMTPREYRLLRSKERAESNQQIQSETEDIFKSLRHFRNPSISVGSAPSTAFTTQTISLDRSAVPTPAATLKCVTIGRAVSCLRYDVQAQLKEVQQDAGIEYARIRDIFSDNLFVYYEDENKNPVYSWKALDEVFDFLLSIGIRPISEIGYMPSQMASKKQYAGWQYHPNVSFPKSVKSWQVLIARFFEHLIARYGAQEVHTWYFGFWTSPNLNLIEGYWNESEEKFFEFYQITYDAIKKVDPLIPFGSPNFSYPSGLSWYQDFFHFSSENNIHPDFLSIHLYGCGDGMDNNNPEGEEKTFMKYNASSMESPQGFFTPTKFLARSAIDDLKKIIKEYGQENLPIFIDDWNVSFFPTDYSRDTCFMGPYILANYFDVCNEVSNFSFNSLSDIHEDFFYTDRLYHGGPGLLDFHSIPKAGYYALSMAYNFPEMLLQKGENYAIAKTERGYEMLIYNMAFYDSGYHGADPSAVTYSQRYNVFEAVHALNCHIELPFENGKCAITKRRVNQNRGSSYDEWLKMGSPSDLSKELVDYLKKVSVPEIKFESVTANNGFIVFDEIVPSHGIVHITIEKK